MAHDSRAVANEILKIGREKGISMSMMKLIKLVYFAHAWMLGLTGKPLCSDPVEAWPYGPVYQRLYNDLPYTGAQTVNKDVIDEAGLPYKEHFTEDERYLLELIIKRYGNKGAFELSNLTHQPGTPWHKTRYSSGTFMPISNDLIAEYYRQKIEN